MATIVIAAVAMAVTVDVPIECTDAVTAPNWPTFHVMNAVTRCAPDDHTCRPPLGASGLRVAHLNDANAIFEFNGIYHVMNQGGFDDPDPDPRFKGVVNWTHAVR
jgi:hypothetical protein